VTTTKLHAELWRAMQFARHELVAPQLVDMRLSRHVQWGIARVEYYGPEGRRYEPRADGPAMALIVPVVEFGDTIDLCAIELPSQRWATRLGLGHGLGIDAVEKARFRCCDLELVDRPLKWIRRPIDSVYLFDLGEVAVALDGVPQITCELALAERVQALLPPSQRERVVVDDG
jgi:hypothetical protein